MTRPDLPVPDRTMRNVNVFVARTGNGFMRDIAAWIVEAATLSGRTAQLVDDRLPSDQGSINLVVAPHEFYVLRQDSDDDIRAAARCSVPICTEQPGTPWFLMALGFCAGSPLVVDINASGLTAIESQGFDAHRLRLGAVPSMDHSVAGPGPDSIDPGRDIDVLFLGGSTDRRGAALARLGPALWNRQAELRMFTFSRPVRGDEPGVVFGGEKYDLLARSKVLVNLHRSDESDGYFEWARMVETMANRTAVVTERSVGNEPLLPGEHFVETELDGLVDAVTSLLDDDERRHALTDAAHRAVMTTAPLASSVAEMLDRIESIPLAAVRDAPRRLGRKQRTPIVRSHAPPLLPEFRPYTALRRDVHDQLLAEMHHRREIGRVRCLVEHGVEDHVERVTTPAFDPAKPEVSVIVTLYNYAAVVIETLESIVASRDVDVEIVVVDDHSTDHSRAVVSEFMDAHLDVPMLLIGSDSNRGLPRSRNLAIEHTRAERVMIIDADNMVYPTCLARLSDALDANPEASFAYATLEAFGAETGLRSERGWYVPWLCDSNYIDAQAMLRRSAWVRHGGYRADDAVHGWEDWDLWLRMAVAGEHGIHLAQMLGRYRTQASSMISITNLVAADQRADLVQRYPSLPWPEQADL